MHPDIARFIRETWVTERAVMQQHSMAEVQRSLEKAAAAGRPHDAASAGILSKALLPYIKEFANKLSSSAREAFEAHGTSPTNEEKADLVARYKGLLSEAKTDAIRRINSLKGSRFAGLIDHSGRDYGMVCGQLARDFELMLASLQTAQAQGTSSNTPVATAAAEVPKKKTPNPDRAIGIVGLVAAILVPLFQTAGVELNVVTASIVYVFLLCILIWSFLRHIVPNRTRTAKALGCITIVVLYGWIAAYAVSKQISREHTAALLTTSAPAPVKNDSHDSSDQRPWIDVGVAIASPLALDEQGDARITFDFTLTNVGKTPAANVQICPEVVLLFGDPLPAQRRIADEQRARSPSIGRLGDVLFPSKTITRSWNMPISRAAIKEFFDKMDKTFRSATEWKSHGFLMPVLVGCVDYKFTFAEGHHQTAFIYTIAVRDPNNAKIYLSPNISSLPIPLDHLLLVPAMGGEVSIPPD